jgi:drug/metabolite transporter (DMT)-like permease
VHLFLPLTSSILYVIAALFLKQAAGHKIGIWRTVFVCNWITAFAFLALLPLGGTIPPVARFWEPVIAALLFIAGQMFSLLALERGDVSVATPVMGAKVVLVAIFTTVLLHESVRWQLWTAAVLSCAGVALLGRPPSPGGHRKTAITVMWALKAAASFALFDVLVMKWAPSWGPGRFLPIMILIAGCLSFVFVPLFREPLSKISASAARPLLLGSAFIAMQALILIFTLARFGDATAVNVVYCSRGLWSVLAVWFVGHWFKNNEQNLGKQVLGIRLAGAALLCGAIVLLFV